MEHEIFRVNNVGYIADVSEQKVISGREPVEDDGSGLCAVPV